MSVQLPDDVVIAHRVVLTTLEAHHHVCGNSLAPQHERQSTGEIFAMPRVMIAHEILDGIQSPVSRLVEFQRVAVGVRIRK